MFLARLSFFAVLLSMAVFVGVSAAGATPPGPRLAFLEGEYALKKKGGELTTGWSTGRLVSTDPDGGDARILRTPSSLTVGALRLSWSADAGEYAFYAKPSKQLEKEEAGKGNQASTYRAYVIGADGTGVHLVDGTEGTNAAVLSPDGRMLAFTQTRKHHPRFKGKNLKSLLKALEHTYEARTTWVVPTAGGRPRRLTPWQNHLFAEPTSFSPDGTRLLVSVAKDGSKPEVDAIEMATGKRRTVEVEASEAAYSPDGSKIAFTSYRDRESAPGFDGPEGTTEVYVAAADGSHVTRVTHTPKRNETDPNFDPSGERLTFGAEPGGLFGLLEGKAAEVNVDGSCPTTLTPAPPRHKKASILIGAPSWLPGPERGAGPISC